LGISVRVCFVSAAVAKISRSSGSGKGSKSVLEYNLEQMETLEESLEIISAS